MAILIVDDETSTRDALREMLIQQGHKVILEGKNGQDGLKILESEKNKIQMIIADWEMPYMDGLSFVKTIGEKSQYDLIPFLLITSDLSKARLLELKTEYARLDHALLKPFRMSTLAAAIQEAQANRAKTRRVALFLGEGEPPVALKAALSQSSGPLQDISKTEKLPGAVFVQPTKTLDLVAMQNFRKTTLGSSIPWVSLSRVPADIFSVRTLCQFFHSAESDYVALIQSLNQGISQSWQVDLLLTEAKSFVQQKDPKSALKIVKKAAQLDASNPEIHALLGDIQESLENLDEACTEYEQATSINPCAPRTYIKLFSISTRVNFNHLNSVAEAALLYCPQNQDVLWAAAQALQQNGNVLKARNFAEALLKINPKHENAIKLLNP